VKTDKAFFRPMNRVVHAHIRSVMPEDPRPDAPVFLGGGARPNARFQTLCKLAGIKPRIAIETGREEPWERKDLRKTCATYDDEHVSESSDGILGHSVRGTRIAATPTASRWPSGRALPCRSRVHSRRA
jgi:hypothetical protein